MCLPYAGSRGRHLRMRVRMPRASDARRGDYGRQILTFLPKADVTELIVQLYTDEERALDYGHVDLWTADNAQMLVWRPILNWIRHN